MGGKGKPRKKRIKQLKEGYLQARDLNDSDEINLAIRSFMDYFVKWKILVTLLTVLGFALVIFVVVDRMFFHEKPEPPYMHKFMIENIGFKSPAQVLVINTPKRRQMVIAGIEKGYVRNAFELDPMTDEGLYLQNKNKSSVVDLLTTVRKGEINKVTLVPMEEPIPHDNPLFASDSMAYFGPRALQNIKNENMANKLRKAENIKFKDDIEVGGMLSLNSDGTSGVYTKEDIPIFFGELLTAEEGTVYFEAQVDISNPNAEELLKEFQESQEQG